MSGIENLLQPPAFSLQSIFQDLPFVSAFLIGRVSGMKIPHDREEALKVQMPFFKKIVRELLPMGKNFLCAHEVHGSEIAIITGSESYQNLVPNVDGLITMNPNVVLGITVADCAPVWIVDSKHNAVALIHSGKRGTEAGIVPKAIQILQKKFASKPQDLIVTIGPCIRPPCYEVDFAKIIREQAMQMGVHNIRDEKICTACDLEKYYSYRREKGKTGHMLGIAMITSI